MALRYLSDLAGTLNSFFRIAGLRLKNTTDTLLSIRNAADTEYRDASVRALELRRVSGTNKVAFAIGSEPAADRTYNFPVAYGTTGQVLADDGAGNLSWTSVATGANQVKAEQELVAFNSGSTIAIFTPPANATIRTVTVEIETAFDGVGAQLSVGVAAQPARYMGATQNELSLAAIFEVTPLYEEDGTPEQVEIAFVAGTGASAGSARITVEYSNPA
jgi:hypothetical protein